MAQIGFTPIQLYFSSTTTNVPLAANLASGELAINITDGKLFYKDNANAVQVIGWKVVPATAGGTGQTSYAVGDLLYANTTTTLAKLPDVATGNALISGGVNTAPSWGKIGLTTHVSGVLPTANGGTNLSSFTANGVVYASSTSALATSSSLTWNGSSFAVTGSTSVTTTGVIAGTFTGKSTAIPGTAGFWNNTVAGLDLYDSDGTAGYGVGIRFRPNTGGVYPVAGVAALAPSSTTSDLVFHAQSANGSIPEDLRIVGSTGDVKVNLGNLVIGTSGKGITTGSSIPLGFGTNGSTTQATIDTSGNFYVATTSQINSGIVSFLANSGGSYVANGLGIQDGSNGSGFQFSSFNNAGGTQIGSIARVTTTNAVVYNTTSDQRLKSNIENAAPILDKLMQVQVRQYDWTEGALHQDYGFVAQELEPLLSGVVTKGKTEEDMWQMDYSRITPHLVKAMQEQQAIITQQSEIINTLTARVVALESK